MRTRRGEMPRGAKSFTVAEHLLVQRKIERRAQEIWAEGGWRGNSQLGDWLQAEREIVEDFVRDRFEDRKDCPPVSRSAVRRVQPGSGLNRKGNLYDCLSRENRR
jgi:hypothetical protein